MKRTSEISKIEKGTKVDETSPIRERRRPTRPTQPRERSPVEERRISRTREREYEERRPSRESSREREPETRETKKYKRERETETRGPRRYEREHSRERSVEREPTKYDREQREIKGKEVTTKKQTKSKPFIFIKSKQKSPKEEEITEDNKRISIEIVDILYDRLDNRPFNLIYLLNEDDTLFLSMASEDNVTKIYLFNPDKSMENEIMRKIKEANVENKIELINSNFITVPHQIVDPYVLFSYPKSLFSKKSKEQEKRLYETYIHDKQVRTIVNTYQPNLFAFYTPKEIIVPENIKKDKITEEGVLVVIEKKRLIKNIIPFPDPSTLKTDKEWTIGLKKFLTNIFVNIIMKTTTNESIPPLMDDEETPEIEEGDTAETYTIRTSEIQAKKLLQGENLQIWKNAFTGESYDAENNYERLEAFGDRVLETSFSDFLFTKYPDTNPNDLTNIKSEYMSKMFQAYISKSMGFDKWIRIDEHAKVNINMQEDVFESFFGAFFRTIQNISDRGVAYQYCYEFLKDILYDIDMVSRKKPKTLLKEIFQKIVVEPEIVNTTKLEKGFETTIELSDSAMKYLVDREKLDESDSNILSYGRGKSESAASEIAYKNALLKLESIGVTYDWATQERINKEFSNPQFGNLPREIGKILKNKGFKTFYFYIPKTTYTTEEMIIEIIGEKEQDGKIKKFKLGSIKKGQDELGAKLQLLKNVYDSVSEK